MSHHRCPKISLALPFLNFLPFLFAMGSDITPEWAAKKDPSGGLWARSWILAKTLVWAVITDTPGKQGTQVGVPPSIPELDLIKLG